MPDVGIKSTPAIAEPLAVAKSTVTVEVLAGERLTVNTNGVVPLLPSAPVTSLIDRLGIGGGEAAGSTLPRMFAGGATFVATTAFRVS